MRLQQVVKDERRPRNFDPREYISTWTEKDLLHGRVVDAWVIIFRTRGCYGARASGCSMCGYVNDVAQEVAPSDLFHQLDAVLAKHESQPMVKVYTSGNFFDDHEVIPEVRKRILAELGDRCDKVIVETLSHLLRPDHLEEALNHVDELEIALGLESTNERVLRYAVNKVWGLQEHARAATFAHAAGATVKTYLLVKPPFLTEREAIDDAVRSGHEADPYSDTISFNPVNVQSRTIVDRLFRRGEYRPPWLWSVVEVLERTRNLHAHIKSHPTAGGMARGSHNCGTCDRKVVDAIEEFSLGLRREFSDLSCECREVWRTYSWAQEFMLTSSDPLAILEA
jgi:archaeosine synthase beta-subunit